MDNPQDTTVYESTLKDREPKKQPEKELLSWSAPERPFKRRNREFYVTLIAIAGIVGLVLFLIDGWAPVVLIIAAVFLFYVMSTVEPSNILYRVSTSGIEVAGKLTKWEDLGRFWFMKRFDSELLVVETSSFPHRMELVVDQDKKVKLQKILKDYLTHEEIPPSGLDKAANWFSKRLPMQ